MTRSRNTEAAFGRFFCLAALPSVLRFRSLFRNPNAGSRAISLSSGCAAWDRFHCFCGAVRARYIPAWTSVRLRQCVAGTYVLSLGAGSLARGVEAAGAGCIVGEGSEIGGGPGSGGG